MTDVLEIEQAIAKLPEVDRLYLAKKILQGFGAPESLSREEKELLDRRSNEVKTGQVKPLSPQELKNRLRSS